MPLKFLKKIREVWSIVTDGGNDYWPDGSARKLQDTRDVLRQFNCPRPCNGRPYDFTVGQCLDAEECGCIALVAKPQGPPVGPKVEIALALEEAAKIADEHARAHCSTLDGSQTEAMRLGAASIAASIRALSKATA